MTVIGRQKLQEFREIFLVLLYFLTMGVNITAFYACFAFYASGDLADPRPLLPDGPGSPAPPSRIFSFGVSSDGVPG